MNETTKKLETLVDDIYALFTEPHVVSQENLDTLAQNIAEAIRRSIEESTLRQTRDPAILRMSKLGTPDRKLWYEHNVSEDAVSKDVNPSTKIKFLYGDILEELLLFFAKEAGHTVEGEQGEVEVNGVLGHRDCKIDGITTDIKSASSFAFNKFVDGSLNKNDPFGYIAQISGYVHADKSEYGAFLAINKESGALALLRVDKVDMIDPVQRIDHLRNNVLSRPTPPEGKCYSPEPIGKSGNEVLNKNCSYCVFKEMCWEGKLRKFKYSDGIKYFTKVVETPRVEEVT